MKMTVRQKLNSDDNAAKFLEFVKLGISPPSVLIKLEIANQFANLRVQDVNKTDAEIILARRHSVSRRTVRRAVSFMSATV